MDAFSNDASLELDALLIKSESDRGGQADVGPKPKQADILLELAQEVELFRTPDFTAFADVRVASHRETWAVRCKAFRRWLSRRFFESTGGAPNSEALNAALGVTEAQAFFNAPEREIYVRIGSQEDRMYIDLANERWQAVEVSGNGWRVVDDPPVRFRRSAGMQALPAPQSGGSVDMLRRFFNVQSNNDFILVIAWMLAALRNCGPFSPLVLTGEQGSAKSTFSAILRSLIDPNPAKPEPKR